MRVAFYAHFWLPYHYAGSEVMGQRIFSALQEAGHETFVIATLEHEAPPEWVYEGTTVLRTTTDRTGYDLLRMIQPDVLLTHHNETQAAVTYARKLGIPTVQVIHNNLPIQTPRMSLKTDLTIYNTEWIRDYYEAIYPTQNNLVLHPPIYAEEHRTEPGDAVTLINLNRDKGSGLFYELAQRMPDVEFLAVEGGHGYQVFEQWPNVTLQRQTTNMRDNVWGRTKILLMPSKYESYGMAGVEALASGIPVLASPTPGLKESLSYAGIFIDRDDVDGYEREIRRLLTDDSLYLERSLLASARSNELDPAKELAVVTQRLEELVWPTQR